MNFDFRRHDTAFIKDSISLATAVAKLEQGWVQPYWPLIFVATSIAQW